VVALSNDVAFTSVPSDPDVGEEKRKWYVLRNGPPRHCSALSANLSMGGTTAGEDEGRLHGVASQRGENDDVLSARTTARRLVPHGSGSRGLPTPIACSTAN